MAIRGQPPIPAVILPNSEEGKAEFVKDVASTWDMSFKGMIVLGVLGIILLIGYVLMHSQFWLVSVGLWILAFAILLFKWQDSRKRERKP